MRDAVTPIIIRVETYHLDAIFLCQKTGLVPAFDTDVDQPRIRAHLHLFGHEFGQLQTPWTTALSIDDPEIV
jgi:hypothetical protein